MTDPLIIAVFIAAVAGQVLTGFIYIRTTLASRLWFVRLAFASRELALVVLALGGAEAAPWTVWPFALYVIASGISRAAAIERPGASTAGAARLLFKA